MRYDATTHSLAFASQSEVEEFHAQLVDLLRTAMITATRRIPDSQEAKVVSREVMKDHRAVMRALNVVRSSLPRKTF
jgi:hypothetical protein